MSREILFRGKRVDNVEWCYGDLIHNGFDGTSRTLKTGIAAHGCYPVEVAPETIGQFTGLTDKNGVKIFEGDIVKWDDMSDGKYWRIAVTKINPDIQFDCFGISEYMGIENSSQYCFRYGNFIYKDTNNHLEIIGNIHDNPELIK